MKRGFTVVELMVVIAIIGVLAVMIIPNLSKFVIKARDARRKADLNSIQLALESYFEDNSFYPPGGITGSCPTGWDCNTYKYSTSGPQWIPEITTYVRGGTVPQDPINNTAGPWSDGYYSYAYGNVGKTTYSPCYNLTAQLEDKQDPDRCGVKCYQFHPQFTNIQWCTACGGNYSNQIYEIGPLTR